MSIKAYVFRLRHSSDVDDLDSYIKKMGYHIAWINFIYKPTKKVLGFSESDFAAAISVDRGDLRESFAEAGIHSPNLYFERVENMECETVDGGTKVVGMEPCLDMNNENWKGKVQKRLLNHKETTQ